MIVKTALWQQILHNIQVEEQENKTEALNVINVMIKINNNKRHKVLIESTCKCKW